MKKSLITLFKLIIFILALTYIVYSIDLKTTFQLLITINPLIYIFSFLIFFFNIALSSYKWKKVLNVLKIEITHITSFVYYVKGYIYNYFLPSNIGGDIAKTVWLKKDNKKTTVTDAFLSSFYDRLTGLIALVFLLFISLLLVDLSFINPIIFSSWFLFLCLAIFVIGIRTRNVWFKIFFHIVKIKKITKFFKKIQKSIDTVFKDRSFVLFLLGLSLIFHLLGIFGHYLLFVALGVQVDLILLYVLLTSGRLFNVIPLSFGGIGSREAFLLFVGGFLGFNSEAIIAYSLLVYTYPVLTMFFFYLSKMLVSFFSKK